MRQYQYLQVKAHNPHFILVLGKLGRLGFSVSTRHAISYTEGPATYLLQRDFDINEEMSWLSAPSGQPIDHIQYIDQTDTWRIVDTMNDTFELSETDLFQILR